MGNRHSNYQGSCDTNTVVDISNHLVVDSSRRVGSTNATPLHHSIRISTARSRLNKSASDSCFVSSALPSSSMSLVNSLSPSTNAGTSTAFPTVNMAVRPLKFHNIHGDNVMLSRNNRMASRTDSFCKALAFSDRPVAVNEVVCIRFAEFKTDWNGVLRFGITNTDPATFGANLPKYVCPDMTSKEGTWAKAVGDRYCQQGNTMHFFVQECGEMYYGVNGHLRGLFLSGIDTRAPMFVVIDIYGKTTAVEFLDNVPGAVAARESQTRPKPSVPPPPSIPPPAPPVAIPTPQPTPPAVSPRQTPAQQQQPSGGVNVAQQQLTRELEQRLNFSQQQQRSLNALSSAPISNAASASTRRVQDFAPLTYNRNSQLDGLQFHTTRGRNVGLNVDRTIATRSNEEYCGGYVFTCRPIRFMEKVIIQILGVEGAYNGGLAFGVTNCDPSTLTNYVFPDDSDELLNRPEFWAVNKDYEKQPNLHDELAYFLNDRGELMYQKNNDSPRILFHVDPSLTYYMFFDIYGRAQCVRCVGTSDARSQPAPLPAPVPAIPQNSRRRQQPHPAPSRRGAFPPPIVPTTAASTPAPAAVLQQFQQLQTQAHHQQQGRNAGLTVNLPPVAEPRRAETNRPIQTPSNTNAVSFPVRAVVSRHNDHHGRYNVQAPPRPNRPPPPAPPQRNHSVPVGLAACHTPSVPSRPSSTSAVEAPGPSAAGAAAAGTAARPQQPALSECSVCMDHQINCAVYPCGHMCMCYECGRTTWSRQGVCPICRQNIKDILRLFPSS